MMISNNINKIIHGNALDILKTIDNDSIDSMVTDPPYGYSFMNKDWDKAVVSVDIWKECLRVLKPGAFAFIMSSPRQDVLSRMIVNLQDAGFRTDFTSIYHTYASGFPKAANTSKLIQKRGLEKEELNGSYLGFQPKPAVEVILTVMKPLSEKSFIDQALKNGKGITWLDDCKIKARFPANLIVSDDSLNDGKIRKSSGSIWKNGMPLDVKDGWHNHNMKNTGKEYYHDSGSYSRYFDLDAWYEAQFIITPKASPSERNGSMHPTMKPIKLMSYLIRMGSRENDIVLDPFCGSGTTCIAAYQLNRNFIGIERELEYVTIANKRLTPLLAQRKLF